MLPSNILIEVTTVLILSDGVTRLPGSLTPDSLRACVLARSMAFRSPFVRYCVLAEIISATGPDVVPRPLDRKRAIATALGRHAAGSWMSCANALASGR